MVRQAPVACIGRYYLHAQYFYSTPKRVVRNLAPWSCPMNPLNEAELAQYTALSRHTAQSTVDQLRSLLEGNKHPRRRSRPPTPSAPSARSRTRSSTAPS